MSNKVHPLFAAILDGFMPPGARDTQCPDCGYTYGTHRPTCVAQDFHEESADCWCKPTLNYVNPETGAQHWIHHEPN